ncbi:RagB/SusD family nutrient uptake outer membrane protein [Robertkochia marina]|uniref:RagB/SusD family nutrient uptake outer membrane protein n=1 Tax=Robertkochia marina TaxID=1227945 RepID=A0A4S3M436_9FLAO|nr:SusD/RagB family nutrient-binding outer membrane lipoprotein [Robertkochia marina]THD69916.1 RagB/SusD family nutrient uptake outer membrane protein [Robertkochia marina]TRZ46736.1 RagB/SusD family nutrient uptake outer membrane protein [Robertkochia marina]
MKKIIYSALAVSGLLLGSCSDYTDGLNVDPNNFTDSPGNLVLGQVGLSVASLSESQPSRYAAIFTDQFSGCDRQYEQYEAYVVTAQDFDDSWDDIYADGIAQAKFVREKAIEEGDAQLEGAAMILEALLFGETAALYGNVPFSEAGDPFEFPNPSYDSQTEVLNGVQAMLSEGINKVGSSQVLLNAVGVFATNDATWAEVAHSLKARYYLIAGDYPNALAEAQLGISSPTGNLEAFHTETNGQENSYYQFIVEQRAGYLALCNNPLLLRLMNGTTPRALATPGDAERLAVYFNDDFTEPNTAAGGIFAADANFPIVSWIETKLIQAEAAARTGGDALTPFNEVRAYLEATYGGSFPASSSSGQQLITEILEEKYMSLPGSLQVFHDMRRTDDILGTLKGSGSSIPQRFLYPQVEINANENFPGLEDLFTPTPVNQ